MSDKASGGVAVVVSALRTLGFLNVYGLPVAPWLCEEPVVVELGEFQRDSQQVDGHVRGVRELVVHVCRWVQGNAQSLARTIASKFASVDWLSLTHAPLHVLAGDAGQLVAAGRDSSGRWL